MLLLTEKQVKKIIYKDKTKSYTYGLCKEDGSLFYVGVGIYNRVLQHVMPFELEKAANRLKANTTKKAISNGGVKYVIFLVHADRNKCLSLERELILAFGRIDNNTGILTNLTDGGEIGPTGIIVSEDTRRKKSENGKRLAQTLSDKNKVYWQSLSEDEKRLKVERLNSRQADPALLSEKLRERWADPDYKEKMSLILSKAQAAQRSIKSEQMKKKWADPEYREYMKMCRLQRKAIGHNCPSKD